MKYQRNIFKLFIFSILFLVASCQTRVVSASKPISDNTLDLYQKYTIQTKDAKTQKLEIVKVDSEKIYGKNKAGEMVEIQKNDVREIRKPNVVGSIIMAGIIAAGLVAVIVVPI